MCRFFIGKLRTLKPFDIVWIVAIRMLDYFVFAKYSFVEVGSSPQTISLKETGVIGRFEAVQVDTYIFQQIEYDFMCMVRFYEGL